MEGGCGGRQSEAGGNGCVGIGSYVEERGYR